PVRRALAGWWGRSRSLAHRRYLVPMFGLVALVVALSALAFGEMPVAPGVDPGHWLSISYGYVGLPSAPDPSDQVLYYSPLLFPFLGGLVLATGSPLLAVDILAIGLLLAFGLSVIHVARRFLSSGPLQVALVGLTVLSGPTLQMLFWGGYPNLLGLVLMNETLVALLAFVRSQRDRDGALFFVLAGLTYFAHDLSAMEVLATVAVAAALLLLLGKVSVRFLVKPVNLLGVLGLVTVVGGYAEVTSHLGISHPSYFVTNPAAYFIDEVGELFAPLAHAPLLVPAGPAFYLPPLPTALALAAAPAVALIALVAVRAKWPERADTRLVIAAGWFGAALAVPGAGYLAHVDTDYSRFLYFLPLPFFLVLLLAIERAFLSDLVPALASPERPGAPGGASPLRLWQLPAPAGLARRGFTNGVVAVVLVFVLLAVTVPVIEDNEASGTASAHDAAFVQAMDWLKGDRTAGGVLTVPSAARWAEALSVRDAWTVGPVWLLFDPYQITDTQETYFALTSQDVIVGPQAALSFSGFATPVMSQDPMYTAYVEGVPFPIVRVLAGSLSLNATGPTGTHSYGLGAGASPVFGPLSPGNAEVNITYSTPVASVVESATASANSTAHVRFLVTPDSGVTVRSLTIGLAGTVPDSSTLASDTLASVTESTDGLVLNVTGALGSYPERPVVQTTVAFSQPASWLAATPLSPADSWTAVFSDANRSAPFGLGVAIASIGASNPVGALPPSFSTASFLATHDVAFLLWPNQTFGSVELTYYEATFGFHPVYENSEWVILGQ
ncbi:MAG: hypothetical protein L3K05_01080, partial [Thermoplasmata archaeon]|nr:hypothetical protein [Thermoplasmata archaeon]